MLAGENEEVLCVAAHAGSEVVEAEEVLESIGVALLGLQLFDELELTVQ